METDKKLISIRRKLHQIPELAFEEQKTHDFIREYLESLSGFEIFTAAKTGLIAVKKGTEPEVIAFRADIDALPLEEKTGYSFASRHSGKMHACGHDMHTAILLGLADYISANDFKKTIMLIFQPAEEGPGGAEQIISDSNFRKYDIDKIFALHVSNDYKVGSIALKMGAFSSYASEFHINLEGKKAHAASPHLGLDMGVAASQLVTAVNQIISRKIDPFDSAVISIGKINVGERVNVIPSNAYIGGTVRTPSKEILIRIQDAIKHAVKGITVVNSCKADVKWGPTYPPVHNHRLLFIDILKATSELKNIHLENLKQPLMIGEDFGFFSQHTPAFMFFLGSAGEKGKYYGLHTPEFNPEEACLIQGYNIFKQIITDLKIKK